MVPLNMFTGIFVIHGLSINDPGHILVCRFERDFLFCIFNTIFNIRKIHLIKLLLNLMNRHTNTK